MLSRLRAAHGVLAVHAVREAYVNRINIRVLADSIKCLVRLDLGLDRYLGISGPTNRAVADGDTARNPARREFARTFCRTDKRARSHLAHRLRSQQASLYEQTLHRDSLSLMRVARALHHNRRRISQCLCVPESLGRSQGVKNC